MHDTCSVIHDTEVTPLLSITFGAYSAQPNMSSSADSRTGKNGHPKRKTALKGRLKEIVLLELREDG
jgi:hypothetical protein|eukprot:scaffold162_cov267-Chaetoceros_neogracile.AAC.21